MYRCEVSSIEGFIQQLAVGYISRGYFFYVTGRVPYGKDPRLIDQKLIEKYGVDLSPWARARRKRAGMANLQYVRFEDFFVLLATQGGHRFFEEEATMIRDLRENPLKFAGYALSYRGGHAHVRIEQRVFNDLKAYLVEHATHRSKEILERAFRGLEFEPYAPVRSQLFQILRTVNNHRQAAGFAPIPQSVLRLRRRIVRPFELNKSARGISLVA